MRLQIQHKNPSSWGLGNKGLCCSFLLRSHTHTHTTEGPSATPGLNHTNVFPYSSEVRNLESNVSKAVSFWSLQGRMCPCLFQLPEAAHLPWLVAPSSSCDFFFFLDCVRSQLRHKASSLWPVGSLSVAHVES